MSSSIFSLLLCSYDNFMYDAFSFSLSLTLFFSFSYSPILLYLPLWSLTFLHTYFFFLSSISQEPVQEDRGRRREHYSNMKPLEYVRNHIFIYLILFHHVLFFSFVVLFHFFYRLELCKILSYLILSYCIIWYYMIWYYIS